MVGTRRNGYEKGIRAQKEVLRRYHTQYPTFSRRSLPVRRGEASEMRYTERDKRDGAERILYVKGEEKRESKYEYEDRFCSSK